MNDDIVLPIIWGVSALVMILYGIIQIKNAKKKSDVTSGWMTILCAFTPGAALIGFGFFFVGVIILIVEGPTKIIWSIKKKLSHGNK